LVENYFAHHPSSPDPALHRYTRPKISFLTPDKDKLDRFIAKPDEVVPGNNMKPYGGLASAEDRAKVIEFLVGR